MGGIYRFFADYRLDFFRLAKDLAKAGDSAENSGGVNFMLKYYKIMQNIREKIKLSRNKILSVFLLLAIAFSIITIVYATAPNPGHNFTESSGGLILGDLIYGSGADTAAALAGNITVTKKFLNQTGNGSVSAAPIWSILAASDIPDISATYSAKAGNTSLVTVGTLTTGALGTGFTAVNDAQISSATTWNAKMTDPMTTIGDIIIRNGSNVTARLAGAAGFLKGGVSTAPSWSTINLAASADVGSSILPTANGGTGIAYFTAAGPTVARTYTFPDANATVLTNNAAVTVAQGGTGVGTLTGLALGNGTSNFSAYGGTSCTNQFPRSLNASGVATCAAASLTADVSGILPTANGGTGIAFFTAAGPTVARIYTFPDAAATVLTSNAAVTVAQGGTGLTAAVSDAVLVGDSTSAYTARSLPASCAGTTAKLLYDSTTNLFSCGTDQTSGGGATYVVTTADSASAAVTTYANITGLSWTVAASTRYDIHCEISYSASVATIGIGIGWTGPASPLLTTAQMVSGIGTQTVGGTVSVGNDTGATTAASAGTTGNHATFEGYWSNGTTAGTLQMRFKPETATASGITIKAGSWCKYSTY